MLENIKITLWQGVTTVPVSELIVGGGVDFWHAGSAGQLPPLVDRSFMNEHAATGLRQVSWLLVGGAIL